MMMTFLHGVIKHNKAGADCHSGERLTRLKIAAGEITLVRSQKKKEKKGVINPHNRLGVSLLRSCLGGGWDRILKMCNKMRRERRKGEGVALDATVLMMVVNKLLN